ncbi:MAG: hypothetical protein AB8B69_22740 [Chitinophagales bacterium]
MDTNLYTQFSWANFLTIAVVLFALYFLLQFIYQILERFNILGNFQKHLKKWIYHLLLVYEPLVLLILGSVFILVYPLFHGLLIGLLLLVGFPHVKNYMSGRIVQFDNAIDLGKQINTQGLKGMISSVGRSGLKLSTNKGLSFVSYSQLLTNGYLLESGEEIGGWYNLKISPAEPKEKVDYRLQLMDLLATTPYLDWTHKPTLLTSNNTPHQIDARVLIKEENHLYDLMTLMEEWGYTCRIAKK